MRKEDFWWGARNIYLPAADFIPTREESSTELQVRATGQIFIIILGCELTFTYYIHPGEPTTRMKWGGVEAGSMSTPTCQTRRNNWFDSEKQLQPFTIVGRVFLCFIWCFDIVHGFVIPWGGQ